MVNPYLFSIQDAKAQGLVVISVVALSVGFPMLIIFLMKTLGMVKSIQMKDPMERIGPLIGTGIFYLWLYINIYRNPMFPEAFVIFTLGATIGLFLAFFINNFSKISLHGVGMGGLVTAVFLIRFFYSYNSFILDTGFIGVYHIHVNLLLYLVIIIAGLVGVSRLYLGAHNKADLYGGYLVGFISQIIAFRFLV
jgi:membrane-associated phospholipid phosphatase